jgi:8-oxo-dGTP pyrophosphatase MutT (NUDIX family)
MSGMSADRPVVLRRRAARVILLDEDDHVLMIHGFDPRTPELTYWYSLGGGIDEGEQPLQAAVREVWEETGLRLDPAALVGPLNEEVVVFPFEGREIHQEQLYYAARTRRFDPAPAAFQELEVRSTVAIDWIDPGVLDRVPEPVYPPFLAELVEALLASEAATSAATSQNWL